MEGLILPACAVDGLSRVSGSVLGSFLTFLDTVAESALVQRIELDQVTKRCSLIRLLRGTCCFSGVCWCRSEFSHLCLEHLGCLEQDQGVLHDTKIPICDAGAECCTD